MLLRIATEECGWALAYEYASVRESPTRLGGPTPQIRRQIALPMDRRAQMHRTMVEWKQAHMCGLAPLKYNVVLVVVLMVVLDV